MMTGKKTRNGIRGEITVFLSLVIVLMISFVGAVFQSASVYVTKSTHRSETTLALESVFAEYDKELLKRYDIFARSHGGAGEITGRLKYYGAVGMNHQLTKVRLLTDDDGLAFFTQAVKAMGGKPTEQKEVSDVDWEDDAADVTGKIKGLLEEENAALPTEDSPLETAKRLQKTGILALVIPKEQEVSKRQADTQNLPSHRKLREGAGFSADTSKKGAGQKALFVSYLSGHFSRYDPKSPPEASERGLLYEEEYLLAGKESDAQNLESALNKILLIRTGVNTVYLMTDSEKMAEAQTAALALTSLLLSPEAAEPVKYAVLLAWAYAESVQDLRVLAKGGRVPAVKTKESWQLSLSGMLKLGTEDDISAGDGVRNGLSYGDYLKSFLLAADNGELTMRALDMVELNLSVPVDECVTAAEIKSTCRLQAGINDTFKTEYEY